MNARWLWLGLVLPCLAQVAPEPARRINLLTVMLGIQAMGDPLMVQQRGEATWLPLGELARQLYLALSVDGVRGRVEGFVIEEKNPFLLDLPTGTVQAEGRSHALPRSAVFFEGEECYVELKALEAWLPLRLRLVEGAAALEVQPLRLLPIQSRWARLKDARTSSAQGPVRVAYDPQAHPYAPLAAPFLDQTLSWSGASVGGRIQGQSGATSFLTADLLWTEARGVLHTDFSKAGTLFRGSLGRRDPEGELLGPLGAKEVALGHLDLPGIEFLSRTGSGKGVLVSNFELNQAQFFDSKSFSGELPQDWDLQLFHNGRLVGFQLSRADGRYAFPEVPLDPGANTFLLVFHGPLGQRREEGLSILADPGSGSAGVLRYRVSHDRPDKGGPSRGQATFEWGVNRHLAPFASVVEQPGAGGSGWLSQVGARGQVAGTGYQVGLSRSAAGGTLAEASFKGRWSRVNWNLRHLEGRSFESEVLRSDRGFLLRRTQLNLQGTAPLWGEEPSHLRLDMKRDRFASGQAETQVALKTGDRIQGLFLTQALQYADLAGVRTLGGEALFRKHLHTWMLQGQVGYSLRPDRRLEGLGLALDSLWAGTTQVQFAVNHLRAGGQLSLSAGLHSTWGALEVGMNAQWSRQNGGSASFQVRTSLGRDPGARRWCQDPKPAAREGSAAVRVFLDTNGNGAMDPGEKPLEGVGFLVNGVPHAQRTDSGGRALLLHLPSQRDVDLGLNVNDLEDPSHRPLRAGLRFIPRPGQPLRVDFPVMVLGEVGGYLRQRGPEGVRPLAAVTLELVDAAGRIVQRQSTGFDGFFVFPNLAPGVYTLQVPAPWLNRRRLVQAKPVQVRIEPGGGPGGNLALDLVPEAPQT